MDSNILRSWNGRTIRQREDGYLSATDMCQACNLDITNFNVWIQSEFLMGYLYITKVGFNFNCDFMPYQILNAYCRLENEFKLAEFIENWGQTQQANFTLVRSMSNSINSIENGVLNLLATLDVGFVYIIEDTITKNLKIGKSKNVLNRLYSLQKSNQHDLQIVKTIATTKKSDVEQNLLTQYKSFHLKGEWFYPFNFERNPTHINMIEKELEPTDRIFDISMRILKLGCAKKALREYLEDFKNL